MRLPHAFSLTHNHIPSLDVATLVDEPSALQESRLHSYLPVSGRCANEGTPEQRRKQRYTQPLAVTQGLLPQMSERSARLSTLIAHSASTKALQPGQDSSHQCSHFRQ